MRRLRGGLVTAAAITALLAGACGTDARPGAERPAERTEVSGPRISVSYNGGILVLDRDTLEPVGDLKLPGFLRLNPAGDQRHLLISTSEGFRVLDTGVEVQGHGDHNHWFAGEPALTPVSYPAPHPGHVVRHAGKVALFSDGAGTVQVLDPKSITAGPPGQPTYTAAAPHHGVAVPLPDGSLFVSVGTEDGRTGAQVVDADGTVIAASEDCPDLHGEATTADGTVLAGCTDGVLLWQDGEFVKIDSPDGYGRIGNQAGSPRSDVVLGDYKVDPEAELEEPTRVSLIDTTARKLRLVELGTSYSFRSLGRGPDGEALVLGTDGRLHVIDPDTGKITDRIEITRPWREPRQWQDPRPTLLVEGNTAWVTEPATSTVHVVYLPEGKVVDSVELPEVPNEIAGVGAEGH